MVQFKDLANVKGDRRVREVVFTKGETIKVFEPDENDISEIFALQEKFIDKDNPERLKLTGRDVIKLFSLLTDIDGLDDITDEEAEHVINNPSIALLNTQHIIEGIVTEVYKMVILSVKNKILETDLDIASAQTSHELMERTLDLARRDGETEEHAKRVDDAKAKVVKLHKAREEALAEESKSDTKEDNDTTTESVKTSGKSIGRHANTVAQFKNTFGEVEED